MILLVTGGRNNTNARLFDHYADQVMRQFPIALVVHGACGQTKGRDGKVRGQMRGTDALAHAWATRKALTVLPCPAEWDEFPRAGGPMRNEWMGDLVADHEDPVKLCLAFPGGTGTAGMVAICKRREFDIPVWNVGQPFPSLERQGKLVRR